MTRALNVSQKTQKSKAVLQNKKVMAILITLIDGKAMAPA
jgi:hypothetical protein